MAPKQKAKTESPVVSSFLRLQSTYSDSVHFQQDQPHYFVDVIIDRGAWHHLGAPHGIRIVITEEES